MQFRNIGLKTKNLEAQRDFYADVLGLILVQNYEEFFSVSVGRTLLTFENQPDKEDNVYHFGFNIPENKFDEALVWVDERTAVLAHQTDPTANFYHFKSWNAHALYFKDPDGNVLECIARHNLDNASDKPFDSEGFLAVSEIGLSTPDVLQTVAELQSQLDIPIYDGEGSDQFCAMGDEAGLFIIVPNTRSWLPTTDKLATPMPVTVGSEQFGDHHRFEDLPYMMIKLDPLPEEDFIEFLDDDDKI